MGLWIVSLRQPSARSLGQPSAGSARVETLRLGGFQIGFELAQFSLSPYSYWQ